MYITNIYIDIYLYIYIYQCCYTRLDATRWNRNFRTALSNTRIKNKAVFYKIETHVLLHMCIQQKTQNKTRF